MASTPCMDGLRTEASTRGAAFIELAVSLPVLLLILFGAIDLGRVFRTTMVVTNAARAGAQFGGTSSVRSGDTAGMVAAASAVLADNGMSSGAVPTATRTCDCGTASAITMRNISCVTPTASGCPVNQVMVRVSVTASRTFDLTTRIPGLPQAITVTRTASMRAQ